LCALPFLLSEIEMSRRASSLRSEHVTAMPSLKLIMNAKSRQR